jgi:hypothetical protein
VVERLPSGKLASILTYFQRKVNTKFLLLRTPEVLRKKTLAVLAKNPSTTELIPPKKEALQRFFLEYFIHMNTSKRLYVYFCCKNGGQKRCHLIYCATKCNQNT